MENANLFLESGPEISKRMVGEPGRACGAAGRGLRTGGPAAAGKPTNLKFTCLTQNLGQL
jgi:hypothetical protein